MNTGTYTYLRDELDALRRQWRSRRATTGLLLAAGGVVLIACLAAAADNLFRLATGGRVVAALLVWSAAIAGLTVFAIRCLGITRRDDYFAVLVEERHPGLKNRLVNAIQLGREKADAASPALVGAIVDDAGKATAEVDWSTVLDRGALRRAGISAGVVLVAALAYGVFWTPWCTNGLARVFLPFAGIAPYTQTRVEDGDVSPGDVRVPEGAKLAFDVRVRGVIPDRVELVRETGEGDRVDLRMAEKRNDPGRFTATLPEVNEAFRYRVQAGDGHSRWYSVEVIARPRLEGMTVGVAPPSYTGLEAAWDEGGAGDIAALAGSEITIRITASKPLQSAVLLVEGEEAGAQAMRRVDDPATWETRFAMWSDEISAGYRTGGSRVTAPARYCVRMVDSEGYESLEPAWHAMELHRDRPPAVFLPEPGRDLQWDPEEPFTLSVQARDDYGLGDVVVLYRINDEERVRELARFPGVEPAGAKQCAESVAWTFGDAGLRAGDLVYYWAEATDRNEVTGPGRKVSRKFSVFLLTPEQTVLQRELQVTDTAQALEELLRMQRRNRAETEGEFPADGLVARQVRIRLLTAKLAEAMERGSLPLRTMVDELVSLHSGLMADALQLLEQGRDAVEEDRGDELRQRSLPVQDAIVAKLEDMLARMQRNDQARRRLKKIEKTDKPSHDLITETLGKILEELGDVVRETESLAKRFEKLPKRPVDELDDETDAALKSLDQLAGKWGEWAKGTVDDLSKMPTGFVDDFDLRPDAKRIVEEVEMAAERSPATKIEVALEDAGASLATKMLEDLDMWLLDAPDSLQWIMEEPLGHLDVPEMPLPSELVDLMGDLLQDAEDFDQEAEDVSAAWGDNLNQAGWGVMDGPISSFSAKGVTGNDLPNQTEVSGRAGDGRRGKSSGQAVGDSWRALEGRDTPARLSAERYEPGVLKQLGQDDPKGVTGGGKKAGTGETGLQGGTPPDFIRDMKRLQEWQVRIREKTERVAQRLEMTGRPSPRLSSSMAAMTDVEESLEDLRYEDAARQRRVALSMLNASLTGQLEPTGIQHGRARNLPAALREELVQATREPFPAGYEELLADYFRALSEAD